MTGAPFLLLRFLWASKENEGAPLRHESEKKYELSGRETFHMPILSQQTTASATCPTLLPAGRRRSQRRSLWAPCCGLLLCLLGGQALAATADEIMTKAYALTHGLRVEQAVTRKHGRDMARLINFIPGGRERVSSFESYVNSRFADRAIESRALTIFRSGKQRGVGILLTSYRDHGRSPLLEIWLPALRKTRRFASPSYRDYWAGSVLTYGDVALRRPEDETHQLLGKEPFTGCPAFPDAETAARLDLPEPGCEIQGKTMYRVRSEPRFPKWWYDYRITWLDVETYAPWRSDYFKAGKKIKTIDVHWRPFGEDPYRDLYPRYLYARDLASGRASLVYVPETTLERNPRLPERFWSAQTLRKIRR